MTDSHFFEVLGQACLFDDGRHVRLWFFGDVTGLLFVAVRVSFDSDKSLRASVHHCLARGVLVDVSVSTSPLLGGVRSSSSSDEKKIVPSWYMLLTWDAVSSKESLSVEV